MRVLFINHSASRTGAPIVLLHFLKWLKTNTEVQIDVLTLRDDDLLDDFTKVSDFHFYHLPKERRLMDKVLGTIKKKLKKEAPSNIKYPLKQLEAISKNDYNLIYANTVVSLPVATFL